MRRAIGPIVTTAAALVVAGAVVANPIDPPHDDVRIPAVQLSANSDDSGMLDAAFLAAIAPAPPDPTNPLSVLRQLITSIAADVTEFGRTAIVDAFLAGVTAASQPELTATSLPYVGPATDLAVASPLSVAGTGGAASGVDVSPSADGSAAKDAGDDAPLAAAEATAQLTATAGSVSAELIAAAFSAGAVVAAEPELIVSTLRALVAGDIGAALKNAVKAVAIPLPAMIVLGVLRGLVASRMAHQVVPDPVEVRVRAATAGTVSPVGATRVQSDRRNPRSDPARVVRSGVPARAAASLVGRPAESAPSHARGGYRPHGTGATPIVSAQRVVGLHNPGNRR